MCLMLGDQANISEKIHFTISTFDMYALFPRTAFTLQNGGSPPLTISVHITKGRIPSPNDLRSHYKRADPLP